MGGEEKSKRTEAHGDFGVRGWICEKTKVHIYDAWEEWGDCLKSLGKLRNGGDWCASFHSFEVKNVRSLEIWGVEWSGTGLKSKGQEIPWEVL